MLSDLHIVTGAFGFTGRYIASRLLKAGKRVRTLTNSPDRPHPFGQQIEVFPYNFDHPKQLTESLRGAAVLYNTYWVRFDHPRFTFDDAVANSRMLLQSAIDAGVGRVVHISITNPALASRYSYFRGKAQIEEFIYHSTLHHSILRPALIFGLEDILINNIAWGLRHFPVFPIFGNGQYKMQPVFVDDLAAIAVDQGQNHENATLDVLGPETFTYKKLVETISDALGLHRALLPMPPVLAYAASRIIGSYLTDVLVTKDEIRGLMDDLLYTKSKPIGKTRFSDWVRDNAHVLGCRYKSELDRRFDRHSSLISEPC